MAMQNSGWVGKLKTSISLGGGLQYLAVVTDTAMCTHKTLVTFLYLTVVYDGVRSHTVHIPIEEWEPSQKLKENAISYCHQMQAFQWSWEVSYDPTVYDHSALQWSWEVSYDPTVYDHSALQCVLLYLKLVVMVIGYTKYWCFVVWGITFVLISDSCHHVKSFYYAFCFFLLQLLW